MPLHSKCIPQEIAAIDLGSNSFHMVIARIVNGALQVLGRLKKRVHLAEGLDNNNLLSQEAMERGLSCLALFAERLQGFSPDNIRVVATHALRQAANADVFLQRAALVIPYPIEIISGHEEALLIFRGVEHTQPEKGRKLVIDIGGGSTELVIGEDFKPLLVKSRPMGCVSFAKKFFPDGEINKINFQRAQLATTQKLETLASQYKTQGWQYALGTSGSIKTVTEILLAMGEKDGLITVERLQLLRDQVLQFNHVNTLKLPGLPEDRRSIFIPGLAIISGIFDTLAINTLRFSDSALREGVLYEMEGRFRHQDIRQRTAQSLVDHYNIDRNQARRVMQTSQQLYAQWQMQNSKLVQPHLTPLLKWAAMLHEIGLSINHSAMQRHSAYILQHINLPGFNQEQQLLLAMLVRFHRKTIKLEELPKFNLFKKKHYLPLIQLLRLSTLLNNQRQATTTPESLQLITHDNHWTLRFPQDYLAQNNLLALDFEREQAYWNNVTDWQLTIE